MAVFNPLKVTQHLYLLSSSNQLTNSKFAFSTLITELSFIILGKLNFRIINDEEKILKRD